MAGFSSAFGPGFAVAAVAPPADTIAPAWPVGAEIGIAALSSSGYTASVPAATDAVGVAAYRWTLAGAVLTGVTGTSYTRTGATPGGTETLTVTALDAAGNASAPPLTRNVTMLPIAAPPLSAALVKRWARIDGTEFDDLLPMMIETATALASHETGVDYSTAAMPAAVQQYVCAHVAYWIDCPDAQGQPAPHLERLLDPYRTWH